MSRTVSTVPAVLDALVQRWSLALPDAQVTDGQPLDPTGDDIVCVGFNGNPGEAVVSSALSRDQLSADLDRELYDIACIASSWRGSQRDPKAVRNAAYALVAALADDLARDQRIGRLVNRAYLTAEDYAPLQADMGAVATVHFTVHVDAFTYAG